MKRRRRLPPRIRKLYVEHVRLGMPSDEAAKWAWILVKKRVRDRDWYGFRSVRLARSSKG